MTNNSLMLKIKELSKNSNLSTLEKLEKIEILIEEKLRCEPNNVVWLLRLAVLGLKVPLVDWQKSIICLEKVLALEKDNVMAWLLLAYINYYELGGIDESLMIHLNTLHTENNEINAMLKYCASWFYEKSGDTENQMLLLKESIDLYQGYVWNYVHLAQLYFQQDRIREARNLVQIALKNVKKVYSFNGDEEYDIVSIDRVFDEEIKGTHLSKINFENISKLLN